MKYVPVNEKSMPAGHGKGVFDKKQEFLQNEPEDNLSKMAAGEVQECLQCGVCCEKWGWDQKGIPEDLIPWIRNRRTDILQHVGIRFRDGARTTGTRLTEADLPRVTRIEYWVSPSGTTLSHCPFYDRREDKKVYCRIHTMKPAVCIGFAPWAEVYHDYGLNCPACRDIAP